MTKKVNRPPIFGQPPPPTVKQFRGAGYHNFLGHRYQQQANTYQQTNIPHQKFCNSAQFSEIFKALALWADALYKSKCPSACPSVCLFVRLSVRVFTFEVPFKCLFAPPFLKSDVKYF